MRYVCPSPESPLSRIPLRFREKGADKSQKAPLSLIREQPEHGGRYIYLCRDCYCLITSQAQETAVNAKHVHVFPNPHGLVFEIGCFSDAVCFTLGQPTTEFTWFPGYAWDIAMCISCKKHLGWLYTGRDNGFYGLILQTLVKEKT